MGCFKKHQRFFQFLLGVLVMSESAFEGGFHALKKTIFTMFKSNTVTFKEVRKLLSGASIVKDHHPLFTFHLKKLMSVFSFSFFLHSTSFISHSSKFKVSLIKSRLSWMTNNTLMLVPTLRPLIWCLKLW